MTIKTPKNKTFNFIDKQAVLTAISPEEFFDFELALKENHKSTWNNGGLCPFHDDKNPGSFFVNFENGAFCCFSCNAKGGDIISFTQQLYGLDFHQTLAKLADEWGV